MLKLFHVFWFAFANRRVRWTQGSGTAGLKVLHTVTHYSNSLLVPLSQSLLVPHTGHRSPAALASPRHRRTTLHRAPGCELQPASGTADPRTRKRLCPPSLHSAQCPENPTGRPHSYSSSALDLEPLEALPWSHLPLLMLRAAFTGGAALTGDMRTLRYQWFPLCPTKWLPVSKNTEPREQQGQEVFADLFLNDQQDEKR